MKFYEALAETCESLLTHSLSCYSSDANYQQYQI